MSPLKTGLHRATMSSTSARDFDEVVGRLDQIVEATRSKQTSLEESLDLLDEAVDLWLGAMELVDDPAFGADQQAGSPDAHAGEGGASANR